MAEGITFYGKALIGEKVAVFPSTKRTGERLVTHYDRIIASFPNTAKGNRAADAEALRLTLEVNPGR